MNASKLNTYAYASKTADVATTAYMTTEIATTENVAYMTTGDAISATQNVAYGQVPPGTDDCYIGVGASPHAPITASSLQKSFLHPCVMIMWFNCDVNL